MAAGHGERATIALTTEQSLVFYGFSGDFSGDKEVTFALSLKEEHGLSLVGDPVRSLSDTDRRVWAVSTDDPDQSTGKLARRLRKQGYTVARLHVSAFSMLGSPSRSQIQRAIRSLERGQRRFWAASVKDTEGVLWTFHDPKLAPSKIRDGLRKSKVKASGFHQEVELQMSESADGEQLSVLARDQLDLVRSSVSGDQLIIDIYLRGADRLMAIPKGSRFMACPSLQAFLDIAPEGGLGGQITLDNLAYPFR